MNRLIPLLAIAAACSPEGADLSRSSSLEYVETPEAGPRQTGRLTETAADVLFRFTDGAPVVDAMACSSEGCVEITGRRVLVPLAPGEVEIVLEGRGIAQQVYAYRAPRDMVMQLDLTVDRVGEIEALAEDRGIWQDPELATVIQPVMEHNVRPHLDGADGPYFLDANGDKADTLEMGGSYVFFNVPPGEGYIELEVCNDDVMQWGAPRDCTIEVATQPGDVLRLLPLMGIVQL